ncbi:MAG: PIN domain-containing protein [Dehalococcoidia bacterium]
MKYSTDANWAIDLLRGEPQAVALQPILLADGLALSIVVYMEVIDGVYKSRDPKAA